MRMEGGNRSLLPHLCRQSSSTGKNSRDEVRDSRIEWRNTIGIASNVAFFGSLGRVSWKTIGQKRRVRARGTSKRRINSPRFGRLKKYAGNCERPAAGGWLARDGSRGRRESSRKLVRTLVSGSIWVQIFLQKKIYI